MRSPTLSGTKPSKRSPNHCPRMVEIHARHDASQDLHGHAFGVEWKGFLTPQERLKVSGVPTYIKPLLLHDMMFDAIAVRIHRLQH